MFIAKALLIHCTLVGREFDSIIDHWQTKNLSSLVGWGQSVFVYSRLYILTIYKPGVLFMGHRQTEQPQMLCRALCDATKRGVPSEAILFAYMIFIEK